MSVYGFRLYFNDANVRNEHQKLKKNHKRELNQGQTACSLRLNSDLFIEMLPQWPIEGLE